MENTKTIAVVGLGLIGGSILKGLNSLKNKDYRLIGVSRSEETVKKALEEGLISEGSTQTDICREADVVFVCTPINKTVETIKNLAPIVKKETIITDAASLKAQIVNEVAQISPQIRFIGGHPMAGTENKGLDSSIETLFQGEKWVITPSPDTDNRDIETLSSIIQELGAEVIFSNPEEHDKAVALISHFPLLLGHTLFYSVESYQQERIKTLSMKLASSGFRDTTRLAATNPELAKDMVIGNKANLIETIKLFKQHLEALEQKLLEDEEEFIRTIEKLSSLRKQMYSAEGKNIL